MSLILNIIKEVLENGFVKYEDGNLYDKDGNIIEVSPGGTNQVMKIGYASDINGTGFTLENDTALEYIAFKSFAADYVPVVADFAGLWYHRKGLPGVSPDPVPGTDGQPAGFAINFSTATDATKPGTGKIKFNNASLASATEIYLDGLSPSAVDLSGVINTFTDGMLFSLALKSDPNGTLAVFELTAAPTDNGDWFTIPVTNTLLSSNTFSDGAECVFQFFGGASADGLVTESAVIAVGNFARFADNGAGGVKLIDNANTEVMAASLVYKMPSITISGVSDLPAANTFPHGTVVRLHQDNFVGAGSNPLGVFVIADAVNNKWLPFGSQKLFYKHFGTVVAPTLTLTAAGKFDIGVDPVIPAGLLNADSKLIFNMLYRKVGATTPTVRINFGTDLAARENNSWVYTQNVGGTANRDVFVQAELKFSSATTAFFTNRSQLGGGGSDNQFMDATTLLNVASAMKVTYEASTLFADTVHMFAFEILWEE